MDHCDVEEINFVAHIIAFFLIIIIIIRHDKHKVGK